MFLKVWPYFSPMDSALTLAAVLNNCYWNCCQKAFKAAMFSLNDTMCYFLCPGKIDMRKGISSLCGLVHEKMKSEVRNGDVFIFIGSSRSSQAGKAIIYAYTRWDGMMRCGNHEAAVNMSVICPCWLPASHMV